MSLLETIKTAALDAVRAEYPVEIMVGTVSSTNPLEVSVDQRFTLPEDFLIVPERLMEYELNIAHAHNYSGGTTAQALTETITIRRGLDIGDIVLLLRVQGGQQYVVLDRLVQP